MAIFVRNRCTREHSLWLLLFAGCVAQEPSRVCNVDADCASGVCLTDGTCGPTGGDVLTGDDHASGDGLHGDPAGDPPAPGDTSPGDAPAACRPNYDGVIEAGELPLGPDFEAMFRVSQDVLGFSSIPDCSGDTCVWDLVNVGGTTEEVLTGTTAPTAHWFASEPAFATATYVAEVGRFSVAYVCDQLQLGVFEKNDTGVFILGIVSELEEGGTKLVYNPPVPVLKLPLTLDDSWSIETTATGRLCGSMVDYVIDQTYESTVDRAGQATTPYGTFENVLRVNTLMTRHLGLGITYTTVRTHALVTECHTTIATIISEELETDPDFNDPFEVKRLSIIQ